MNTEFLKSIRPISLTTKASVCVKMLNLHLVVVMRRNATHALCVLCTWCQSFCLLIFVLRIYSTNLDRMWHYGVHQNLSGECKVRDTPSVTLTLFFFFWIVMPCGHVGVSTFRRAEDTGIMSLWSLVSTSRSTRRYSTVCSKPAWRETRTPWRKTDCYMVGHGRTSQAGGWHYCLFANRKFLGSNLGPSPAVFRFIVFLLDL